MSERKSKSSGGFSERELFVLKVLKQIARISLNLMCVLLTVLPFSTTFVPGPSKGVWKVNYMYNSIELMILLSPFFILWVLIQVVKRRILNLVFKLLALLLTSFYSFNTIFAGIAQDFSPDIGIGLLFLIFPALLTFCIIDEIFIRREQGSSI